LRGVEGSGVGDFAEELAEDGDAEIVGGDAPVKVCAGGAAFRRATPENPGGEDAIEEGLDEGRAEEVLAFVTFELDTEGFLEG
jgi:hypothetical protein